MRKILFISLGGTIVCVRTKRGLVPVLAAKDLLKSIMLPSGAVVDGIDFLKRTVVYPQDWIVLSRKIFEAFNHYDSFVVTLGTDTLAFASSALSLMLKNLNKPVVLTGAMRILRSPDSDGKRNLSDAFCLAARNALGGVFVVFNGKIFDGRFVSKVRSDNDNAFENINMPLLGHIVANRTRWYNKPELNMRTPELCAHLDTRVITVKLTPQLDAGFLKSLKSYRGILLEGFGDGNVAPCLVSAISALAKKRIVMLASQCLYGVVRHQYEAGATLIKNGVISSRNMTKEMACVKLMWALGKSKNINTVRRVLSTKNNI